MDVDRYLARLGYAGRRDPSLETLRALHRAHLLAVPFENLSIHAGEAIELDEAWLFDKIVGRGRGGFCYELNGLFAALLRALGFSVERLAARVYGGDGAEGIPFDHMTLRVRVDGDRDWLADVGFGDCFIGPIPLEPGPTWVDERRSYRLRAAGDELVLDEQRDGAWKPQYIFGLTPYALRDFEPGCHYHQTSPASHFTQRRVCSRLTDTGRITVSDGKLTVTHADGSKTETPVADDAFAEVVARELGVRP